MSDGPRLRSAAQATVRDRSRSNGRDLGAEVSSTCTPRDSTESLSIPRDSDVTVPPLSQSDRPIDEQPRANRDAKGRLLPGNTLGEPTQFRHGNEFSLKHGLRRRQDPAPMRAAMQEVEEKIFSDLGGVARVAETKRHLAVNYARFAVLADGLVENIVSHGLVTSRGRTRAQFGQLVSLVDRMTRLAAVIGVDRRQREVSLSDYLDAQARRADAPESDER